MTRYWSVSETAAMKCQTWSILECLLLSVKVSWMWLWVVPPGGVQVWIWMFWYRNIVLLTDCLMWHSWLLWCHHLYSFDINYHSWLSVWKCLLFLVCIQISQQKFYMVLREDIDCLLWFLMETFLLVSTSVFRWGMHIQINNIAPSTS